MDSIHLVTTFVVTMWLSEVESTSSDDVVGGPDK